MAKEYTYSIIGNVTVCDNTRKITAVKLGGKWFDLKGTSNYVCDYCGNEETDIYKVYGKPSDKKVAIWEHWCAWARKNNAHLRILSHSCSFFSIYGYIIDTDETRYNLFITYANWRCSIVK